MGRRLHGKLHAIHPVYLSPEYEDLCDTLTPSRPNAPSSEHTEEVTALVQRSELIRQLNQLFDEVERLDAENRQLEDEKRRLERENNRLRGEGEDRRGTVRRLIEQNKEMREELTLLRLYREGDVPEELRERTTKGTSGRVLSPEAMDFFDALPPSLNFASYFTRADEHDFGEQEAKDFLLRFIQEDLLRPKGHRLEKSTRAVNCC